MRTFNDRIFEIANAPRAACGRRDAESLELFASLSADPVGRPCRRKPRFKPEIFDTRAAQRMADL